MSHELKWAKELTMETAAPQIEIIWYRLQGKADKYIKEVKIKAEYWSRELDNSIPKKRGGKSL